LIQQTITRFDFIGTPGLAGQFIDPVLPHLHISVGSATHLVPPLLDI
jgi:hypothetical protein